MSSFSLKEGGGSRIVNTYWDDEELTVFPFFFKDSDSWLALLVAGAGSNDWYSVMPPMWIHWYKNDSWFFLPAMSWMDRDDTNYSFTSFPLYHRSRDDDAFLQWAACALYLQYDDPENSYTHLFPMLFSYSNKNTNSPNVLRAVLPLFWYLREGTERVTLTPVYGRLSGTNTSGFITPLVSAGHMDETKFFNLLGILYHRNWNTAQSNQYTHLLYPLFSHYRSKYKTEANIVWPLFSYKRYNAENYSATVFPLASYHHNHVDSLEELRHPPNRHSPGIQKSIWIMPWILNKTGIRYSEDTTVPIPRELLQEHQHIGFDKAEENTNVWKRFAAKRYAQHDYRLNSFWPLWKYEKADDMETEFYLLKWLYSYNWVQEQDNAKSRLLWRFLTYDRVGSDYSVDIFPFITYDKKPEDDFSRFSVFWKLYRYEKNKDRRKLNLFFIPMSWGGSGE
jgi:hypothetical protein